MSEQNLGGVEQDHPSDCGGAGRHIDGESGRIGLLMAVSLMIVALFVLISSVITAVALQDRRLLACADRVAAATAGTLDSSEYFTPDGKRKLIVSREYSGEVAARSLTKLADSTCNVGEGARLAWVSLSGPEVEVAVSTQSRLPFLPPLLEGLSAPVLTRSATAHVGLVPEAQ